MAIREHFHKGKIVKESFVYVLRLVERDFISLKFSDIHRDYKIGQREQLRLDRNDGTYSPDTFLELYELTCQSVGLYEEQYKKNAKDLYEFFYDEVATQKTGYYSFDFPISRKKFREKRVPKELVDDAFLNLDRNAKTVVKYMDKNTDVLCAMLGVDRKKLGECHLRPETGLLSRRKEADVDPVT